MSATRAAFKKNDFLSEKKAWLLTKAKLEWPKIFYPYRAGMGEQQQCTYSWCRDKKSLCFLKFRKRKPCQSSVMFQKCCRLALILFCGQGTKSNEPCLYHVNQMVYSWVTVLQVSQDSFLNGVGFAWELCCYTCGFLILTIPGNSTAFQRWENALQICFSCEWELGSDKWGDVTTEPECWTKLYAGEKEMRLTLQYWFNRRL